MRTCLFNCAVDASRAGNGNLEIIVSAGGVNVPNFVKSVGNARFEVSFTPQIADTHIISVKFNGEGVPGSSKLYIFCSSMNFKALPSLYCKHLFQVCEISSDLKNSSDLELGFDTLSYLKFDKIVHFPRIFCFGFPRPTLCLV